jgi:hypothetical protein
MRTFLPILFFLYLTFSHAQPLALQWAKQLAGNSNSILDGKAIAVDAAGNVYTTGNFKGISDFDPGPGTYTLASPGNGINAYVCKLGPQGNFIWARAFYGGAPTPATPTLCAAEGIAVDGNGNVYTTGRFYGQVDFDPGPGTSTLSSPGNPSIFICKLDVLGNFSWVTQLGGATDPENTGNDIAVDALGNTHITGRLNDAIVVAKLDGLGNFTWTLNLSGPGFATSEGNAIALDQGGNVYTAGSLGGACDFDPGPGTYSLMPLGWATFIYKLDPAGNFIWAGQMSGSAMTNFGFDMDVDANGNVYAMGEMGSSVGGGFTDMDPGPATFSMQLIGNVSSYVVKLNANGSFAWAKQFGGSLVRNGGLALDVNANVYAAGYFQGQGIVDFDPGPGTFTFSPSPSFGFNDYLVELDAGGNFVRVQIDSCYFPSSLAIDPNYLYGTGYWGGIAGFNEGPNTYTLISTSPYNAFVYKKGLCSPGPSLTAGSSSGTLCAGENAVLTASGAVSYTWLPGGNGSAILVSPTVTTTYTLIGDDADGCYNKLAFIQAVDECAGISPDAEEKNEFLVYPNPSTGKFQLTHVLLQPAMYELYTFQGELLERGITEKGAFDFSARHYCKGTYFLRLLTDGKPAYLKFILE